MTRTRYRLEAIIGEEDIAAVMAMLAAGFKIELSRVKTITEIAHGLHPAPAEHAQPKPRAKRGNGGEWPPEGSIYSVVLKALESGAQLTPNDLREALKTAGFSAGSLNSALGRLEKSGKAKKTDQGAWAVS